MRFSQYIKEMFTWNNKLLNTLTGKWAGKKVDRELKSVQEKIKEIKQGANSGNIDEISEDHEDALKALMAINNSAHDLFTNVEVQVGRGIKVVKIFNKTAIGGLKDLVETSSIDHNAYVKIIKNKNSETIKLIDKYIKDEYKDLLKLEQGSEEERTTIMEQVKDLFKTEQAGFGKYFLGRLNLKRMNKEMHKAVGTVKEMKLFLKKFIAELKGGEPNANHLKAFDKEFNKIVNDFHSEIQKAVSNSYKAMKRLFLLRFYQLEELKELTKVDMVLSKKVIIPQILRDQFINKLGEVKKQMHADIKTQLEVLRREEAIL